MRVTKAGHMMWVHEIPGDSVEGRPYNPIVVNLGNLTARISGVICPYNGDRTFEAESTQVVEKFSRTVGALGVGIECVQGARVIIANPAPGEFTVFNDNVYGPAIRSKLAERGLPGDLFPARAAHESGLPDPTIPARVEMWGDVALPLNWTPPASWEVTDLGNLPLVQ